MALLIGVELVSEDVALLVENLGDTLNYVYFLGFLSLGVTFVIATGGIDFSIGPVMFCCALVSGYCMTSYKVPCAAAMVICVLIGLAFGIFNGWLVSYLSVPPFIVSMASMNIAKGIASVFTKTQSVSWPLASDPANGWFRNIVSYKGFPVGLVIFLGAANIVESFFTIPNLDVTSSASDPTQKP
ncbi:ABC transporter permease [Alistipes communis]|uniref:ABC transporter permease n=1 Tax=Alistipes communis TaxID=2585118 RepID=UPI003AB265F1